MGSEAVGRGAAMGFQLLVANRLGADKYGLVALALASAAVLAPLADAGLPNLALRKVSERPADLGMIRALGGMKLALSPVFFLPLLVWLVFTRPDGDYRAAFLLAGFFYAFQAASDLFRQVLRARQNVVGELVSRFAYPLGGGLALAALWPLKAAPAHALVVLLAGPVALTFAYWMALPGSSRRPDLGGATLALAKSNRDSLVQSTMFLLIVGLASRADAFILETHSGHVQVGRYFAALNLVTAGGFFGQGLSSYLYPRLHRQKENRSRALARSVLLQASLGLVLFAGVVFLGPLVFRLVFHSASFHGSESLLPGMGATLWLTTVDWIWITVLVGRNKVWLCIVNLVPLVACKLILGPILVRTQGAQGMVWAGLAGEILACALGAITASWVFLKGAAADPASGPAGEI